MLVRFKPEPEIGPGSYSFCPGIGLSPMAWLLKYFIENLQEKYPYDQY